MFCKTHTVAFNGIEAKEVHVEVFLSSGAPAFQIVGLPDKAVAESRERIRASFQQLGLGLPFKRITVNLAPADLQKEGSHYDLPIAICLMGAMGIMDPVDVEGCMSLGELSLDGRLIHVNGVLPSALLALEKKLYFVCPKESGPEAVWAGNIKTIAASNLIEIIRHFKGEIAIEQPQSKLFNERKNELDFFDVKGQAITKRAIEIAATGGHNILMVGQPGVGKSMLAHRIISILPDLSPMEALESTIIYSLSGILPSNGLVQQRPYRDPHHSSSIASIVGGGNRTKPGEISLAHNGVLFLDEIPEFSSAVLESLRQPLETGYITVARANSHITYPARIQLVAAMNPCKCGFFFDLERQCSRAPKCAQDYQNKISGPIMDRFDLVVFVENIKPHEMQNFSGGERSSVIRERVTKARDIQKTRSNQLNAFAKEDDLKDITKEAGNFLALASERLKLSARGYHKILRVARTIADIEEVKINANCSIEKKHIAEAVTFRKVM